MRVPVLTYHGVNVAGADYLGNDHVALAIDLRRISDAGLRIVPLSWVVQQFLGFAERDLDHCVALSCDDGSDYDYFDLDYPPHGRQRSFFNTLLDFRRERGVAAQPDLHLTSFVIASPEARREMDQRCLFGRDALRSHWWRAAQASKLMSIENHSWDHNHPELSGSGPHGMPRGSFLDVNNHARADAEITAAARYIDDVLRPQRCSLFCYPFSHVSDYLRSDYLPNHQAEHGMRAAFGDGAAPITADSDRWNLPRYICGHHWKSPHELSDLLRAGT
jgi:hypothetical protein